MKREEKTTFLSAGRKYGLRFVKTLCTHVQVLGVVAIRKDAARVQCELLLAATFSVLCWTLNLHWNVLLGSSEKIKSRWLNYCFFANQRVLFFAMPFLPHKGFALRGRLKTAKCECLWSSWKDGSSSYLLLKIKQLCSSQNRQLFT